MGHAQKNNITMEVYNNLVSSIQKLYEQDKKYKTLVQIHAKNLSQLGILLNSSEISAIKKKICEIIEKEYQEFSPSQVFRYNDAFYCMVESADKDNIRLASINLHNTGTNDLSNFIFPDVRIVAIAIDQKNVNFGRLVNILADQLFYMNSNFIMQWIENDASLLENLKNNYNDLFELRKAIVDKSACFAFQPIIKCKTGDIAYYECLLRLNDQGHNLISAGSYIMLAEKYGYITSVDRYVFEMAVQELISTQNVRFSVNISNIGVQDKHLVKHVEQLIDKAGVGNRMIIEITETAMNDSFAQTKYFVESMKSLGCKIALDDFGAGYTSFTQVRLFPIDVIKIDGSYIKNITTNVKNRILVESLIKTAEELGCTTVAEFVENGEIAKTLIDLKVDYMQGNFFSPAMNYRSWEKI